MPGPAGPRPRRPGRRVSDAPDPAPPPGRRFGRRRSPVAVGRRSSPVSVAGRAPRATSPAGRAPFLRGQKRVRLAAERLERQVLKVLEHEQREAVELTVGRRIKATAFKDESAVRAEPFALRLPVLRAVRRCAAAEACAPPRARRRRAARRAPASPSTATSVGPPCSGRTAAAAARRRGQGSGSRGVIAGSEPAPLQRARRTLSRARRRALEPAAAGRGSPSGRPWAASAGPRLELLPLRDLEHLALLGFGRRPGPSASRPARAGPAAPPTSPAAGGDPPPAGRFRPGRPGRGRPNRPPPAPGPLPAPLRARQQLREPGVWPTDDRRRSSSASSARHGGLLRSRSTRASKASFSHPVTSSMFLFLALYRRLLSMSRRTSSQNASMDA